MGGQDGLTKIGGLVNQMIMPELKIFLSFIALLVKTIMEGGTIKAVLINEAMCVNFVSISLGLLKGKKFFYF